MAGKSIQMRDSIQKQKVKKQRKKTNNVLLIVAVALFVVGIGFLLVDPIRNAMRKKAVNEGITALESQMSQMTAETSEGETSVPSEMTFVVDPNANAVDGEGYDYFGDGEMSVEDELATYEGSVTLAGIGILEIDSIDLSIPVWEGATVVALRYGAGHYPDSVMPGENGNCSILAHHMRETGSMFNRLDEVQYGDLVRLEMVDGNVYTYEVDTIEIISAEELDARIAGSYYSDARITLVTCTYTANGKMRLIVSGSLVDDQG